jgi:hypothetical protein
MPPQKQKVPKKQGKSYDTPYKPKRACNVLLSDKMKILDLLKFSKSLVEVGQSYGKNESSTCSV